MFFIKIKKIEMQKLFKNNLTLYSIIENELDGKFK